MCSASIFALQNHHRTSARVLCSPQGYATVYWLVYCFPSHERALQDRETTRETNVLLQGYKKEHYNSSQLRICSP